MEKNSPLVSILIPAYNAEKYLGGTLDSALAQTWETKEIIVVDDGSTDNTIGVARSFESKGIRAYSKANSGSGATRNYALSQAKGSLIKFLDADDLLAPETIGLQVERLNGSTEFVASAEWARFYHQPGEAVFKPESVWRDMESMDWLVESMQEGPNMMQPGIWLIPREIINRSGPWLNVTAPNDDFEFMVRVLLHAKGVKFTPGAKLYYRSGIAGSLANRTSRMAMEAAFQMHEEATRSILSFEDSKRTREICADGFQSWLYSFYPQYADLAKKAEKRVQELGGSNYSLPSGKWLSVLSKIVGWKLAKRIQIFFYELGYLKLTNWKSRLKQA